MAEINNILTTEMNLNTRANNEPMRVLSEDDWIFWKKNGYVIIKNAIPKENIERLKALIWEFEEKDPDDSSTWYKEPLAEMKMKELQGNGMVELYNHQYLWNNRMESRIYDAFVDIWGTEKLWVSIDRCNLNMPRKDKKATGGLIHWDVDTSLDPLPQNVQGVLSLVDTTPEMGGFQCIPELYRDFPEWVKTQPEDRDPHHPDTTGYEPKKITQEAGDLLIFNAMQPHGIRPNISNQPRMAQYVSMFPAQENNKALQQERITSWRDRIAPKGDAFPGDPREWEQKKYNKAELTDLGEKLLGLKTWDN